MDINYEIKDEAAFESMVVKLKQMSDQEKRDFMTLLGGYQAGLKVGKRIAAVDEKETKAL